MRRALLLATLAACMPGVAGAVAETTCTIPKGTRVTIRPAVALSSTDSRTGEIFGFSLARDITAPGCTISAAGTEGMGTVFLSGASGSAGHEGDLTLRLDFVRTFDRGYVVFDDQRLRINGKNRKIESAVLGFVPFAGYAAGLIRGSDVHLDALAPIETVLDRPATMTETYPTFVPEVTASPISATPSLAPSPSAS